ncbi:MAG: ATP-binding protein, partial [Acidobacteria bacterium]|nr:ATP-binding protein [Acidobacteriota bacterium]
MGKLEIAQSQVDWLLSREPDDLEALKLAIQVYSKLGQHEKANRFRRIQAALSAEPEPEPTPEPPVTTIPEAPGPADESSEDNLVPMRVIEGGYSEPIWNEEKATVKLEDVAGLEAVKRRLELSLLGPLRNPELMKLYGKNLQGGLLLYGPPGCGKTFMARAVAGELGARFIAIGLNDVLDMYVGQSERNLHELFESARRQKPTVLFFDEIDALGRKRSLNRHAATRDVVNQLLAELDSMSGNNQGIYVLAATNHPWDV